ncbi:MAG: hypothetical protein AAGD14_13740 [Planctomycetota bacterium]
MVQRVLLAHENRKSTESWLLRIGDAAVPALTQAVESRDAEQAAWAAKMLLLLGEVPSGAILQRHPEDWSIQPDAWLTILRADPAERRSVKNGLIGKAPLASLLHAASTSVEELVRVLAGPAGATGAARHELMIQSLLLGLHRSKDAAAHAAIAELAVHPKSPRTLRPIATAIVLEHGWTGATAEDWLAWSRDAETFEARLGGLGAASAALQSGDAELIDAMLRDIREARAVSEEIGGELADAFGKGLIWNGLSTQLEWTPARVRDYILACCNPEAEGHAVDFLRMLRDDRRRGRNVVHGLLEAPESLPFPDVYEFQPIEPIWKFDDHLPDNVLASARWIRTAKKTIRDRWADWNAKQRLAVVRMMQEGLLVTDKAMYEIVRALAPTVPAMAEGSELRNQMEELLEWARGEEAD